MPRYVALLRAINVGGHTVPMAALRTSFAALGCTDVSTLIASGNVLFRTASRSAAALERRIAAALEAEYGFPVATFLRTPDEMQAAAAHPFATVAEGDALAVGFLSRALTPADEPLVQQFATPDDVFIARGRELYWRRQGRVSDSKFTLARFERTLTLEATFRNITTVRKLAELTRQ